MPAMNTYGLNDEPAGSVSPCRSDAFGSSRRTRQRCRRSSDRSTPAPKPCSVVLLVLGITVWLPGPLVMAFCRWCVDLRADLLQRRAVHADANQGRRSFRIWAHEHRGPQRAVAVGVVGDRLGRSGNLARSAALSQPLATIRHRVGPRSLVHFGLVVAGTLMQRQDAAGTDPACHGTRVGWPGPGCRSARPK